MLRRPPDFVIGEPDRPYLLRWWLVPRNRFFNVYLHKILRDDDDRALHDHPWPSISIILRGGYIEVVPDLRARKTPFTRIWDLPQIRKRRRPGSIVFRRATDAHRLELPVEGGGYPLLLVVVHHWPAHSRMGLPLRSWMACVERVRRSEQRRTAWARV